MAFRIVFALVLAALWGTFSPFVVNAEAKPPKRLLVVTLTKGFRHDSIPMAETTLQSLADDSQGKFTVDYARTDDEVQSKMTVTALKAYNAVVFANTTGELPIPDRDAFLAWIRAGHGFVGIHSASDTLHGYEPYLRMLGGEFQKHGPQVSVTAIVEDEKHPATKHFETPDFDVYEEIYEFQNFDWQRVHGLLRMDAHPQTKAPGQYPLSWCRKEGKGRVFYTALGHRQEVWQSPWFRDHVRGGILWVLGYEKGSDKPQKRAGA